MKTARKTRRTAVALAISTAFHIVILALIVSQAAPDYQLPESIAPPMDVQVVPPPEPPPPPVILERLPPLKPPTPKPAPQPPRPPKPQPPEPVPAAPATAAPPRPAPVAPKPAPPQPTVAKPLPAPAPRPESKPAPPVPAAPPTPAPPAPAAPAAPSPAVHLNIHKPEKEAPGSVATLPFAPAPSPSPASPGGAPAATGGEPPLGGSRLQGLTPYPYGSMPSGGSGLRGTLVGCANAESVNLTAAERARCNERFGSRAASAPALDPIAPAKRATFDKAAERQEADRAYRDGGMPSGATRGSHGFGGMGDDQPLTIPLPR